LLLGALCAMIAAAAVGADDEQPDPKSAAPARSPSAPRHRARPTHRTQAKSAADEKATPEADIPNVNLLEGLRAGDLFVEAEGTGDGRMTLSVTNRTRKPLQVVLPPGLIATGMSGQFGGMGGMGGGMGGMGGGMGGMGGGMGGMGDMGF